MKLNCIKKYFFPISILLVVSILYFLTPIMVMPDSTEYYNYLKIFYGFQPLADWNVVRGFSLPLILFFTTKMFGNTSMGLLIGTYISFLVFNLISYYVYTKIRNKISNRYIKYLIAFLYYILIPLNPIMYGYFHGLLTEFVAITLALISCVVSYKFLQSKLNLREFRTYIYLLFYIIIFIFCWFLKQPYFTIAVFPLLIVIVLSIFKYKEWKDFIFRFSILLFAVICLFLAVNIWKTTLINAGVHYESGRNNEYFLKSGIINGISYFRIEDEKWKYSLDYILDDKFISQEDVEKLKNRNDNKFYIINVYNKDNIIIDKLIMYYDGDDYYTIDSLKLYGRAVLKHPLIVANSYKAGYLASIDYYVSHRDEKGVYYPIAKRLTGFSHENESIGLAYLNRNDNMLWINYNTNFRYVKNLKEEFSVPFFINVIIRYYSKIHKILFTFLFLILPITFILLIYLYLFRKKRTKKFELSIIFISFAFLHIMFHVVMGAIIDRYIFVVFAEAFLGYLVLFIPESDEKDKNFLLRVKKCCNNLKIRKNKISKI